MTNQTQENIEGIIASDENMNPNVEINSSNAPNEDSLKSSKKEENENKISINVVPNEHISDHTPDNSNMHSGANCETLYNMQNVKSFQNLQNIQNAYSNLNSSSMNITNINNTINNNLQGINSLPANLTNITNLNNINLNQMTHLTAIQSLNSEIVQNTSSINTNAIYDSTDVQQNEIDMSIQEDNLVLNYSSSKILYGMAFQKSDSVRLAVGTLEKSLNNKIEILDFVNDKMKMVCTENQEYPITKLMWGPGGNYTNTLASSSDIIRLFKFDEETNKLNLFCSLNNKKSKYSSPLTSFDWNSKNPSILGTASIDTTCTIWDLNKNTIRTQLIAHDKEVFDIAFSQNEHIFISTGADGSIRLFDLRSLDHSTIMYETKEPISKIAFNTENSHLISAMGWKKNAVNIIDNRFAMVSLVDLKSHTAPVTGMSWAPQSATHICTVGEDKFVLIWNIESQMENVDNGPILSYKAPEEISNVNWCVEHPEWIAITFKNQLQLLRV